MLFLSRLSLALISTIITLSLLSLDTPAGAQPVGGGAPNFGTSIDPNTKIESSVARSRARGSETLKQVQDGIFKMFNAVSHSYRHRAECVPHTRYLLYRALSNYRCDAGSGVQYRGNIYTVKVYGNNMTMDDCKAMSAAMILYSGTDKMQIVVGFLIVRRNRVGGQLKKNFIW